MGEGRKTVLLLLGVAALTALVFVVPRPGDGGGGASDVPTHGCDDAEDQPADDLRAAERATLCLLNAERRERGLR
ncbi:MAG: hypothetical protein M3340_08580, partial [Actinomycetota bacterium]|nr:hypothetical protein [Actinomycetota bacterium]